MKGKGINLPDTLVPQLPLPVIVQLVNSNVWFSVFYDTADVLKNDTLMLKTGQTDGRRRD